MRLNRRCQGCQPVGSCLGIVIQVGQNAPLGDRRSPVTGRRQPQLALVNLGQLRVGQATVHNSFGLVARDIVHHNHVVGGVGLLGQTYAAPR